LSEEETIKKGEPEPGKEVKEERLPPTEKVEADVPEWVLRVEELREVGASPEEIAQTVLREFYEEMSGRNMRILAEKLGLSPLAVGRMKGVVTRERKKEEREKAKEKKEPELTDRELVARYGIDGLDKVKRKRLEDLLVHADVSKRNMDWIMYCWDTDINVRRNPNELFRLLKSTGMKDDMCDRIVRILLAIEKEFQDLLVPTTIPRYPEEFGRPEPRPQPEYPVPSYDRYTHPEYRYPHTTYTSTPMPQRYYYTPTTSQYPYREERITYPMAPPYHYTPPESHRPSITTDDVRRIVEESISKHMEEKKKLESVVTAKDLESLLEERDKALFGKITELIRAEKEETRLDKLEREVTETRKDLEKTIAEVSRFFDRIE
jgi:hypothetical protein